MYKDALTSDTTAGSEGEVGIGVTIPEDIRTDIIELRRSSDNLEQYVNVEGVTTKTGTRNIEVDAESTPFDNVDEAADFPEMDEPEFLPIEYKVKKKGGILKMTAELLEDTASNIMAYINKWIAKKTKATRNAMILKVLNETDGERAKVKCYGCDDVREGVAVMWKEGVDVSITGNSTNPTRFQHPVAGTYKKERMLAGKPYFSVASGGGTGRTLHPDNMAAGPASYGMTDTMGRMHSDAQFAGSSSVPAHVEMMGFLGIGNNPMVGCTVACAVDVAQALSK